MLYVKIRLALQSSIFSILAVIVFVFPLGTDIANAVEELDEQVRVELQITLKDFIDDSSENEIYRYFDSDIGGIRALRLKALHPVIFSRNEYYMMCADFVAEDGSDVLIDYIVVSTDKGYMVTQQILGRRGYLTNLFDRVF